MNIIRVNIKNKLLGDIIALSILLIVAIFCFINVYVIGSVPVWDGDLYNKLVNSYISNGYTLKSIDTSILPHSQLGGSYANRILFFQIIGAIHYLTKLDVNKIYPVLNFICAVLTSLYIYKTCRSIFKTSFVSSIGAGIWFLLFPAVLIINQVVAHPELLMTALIAMGFYYYLVGSNYIALLLLVMAVWTKQSAVLVFIYIIIDSFTKNQFQKNNLKKIFLYVLGLIISLFVPFLLVQNSFFKFKWDVVAFIIKGFNGNLFQHILFNFEIIWVLFFAGLFLCKKTEQINILILILLGLILSLIGSTDWFRTWFSILFFIVLPLSSKVIDYITSEKVMYFIRIPLVVIISIMLIKPRGPVDLAYAINPNYLYYLFTFCLIIICYIVNENFKLRAAHT